MMATACSYCILLVVPVIIISGCGSSGSLSMIGTSRSSNSYVDFKEAVQRRMVYALDTELQGFERDFDGALNFVESGSDLRLRKLFLDAIGEVQLSLNDEAWAKQLANRKTRHHLTPLWYMGIPVRLFNLIAGSALLRKAAIAKEDEPSRSAKDHSILLSHAQAVLSTNMYQPDSPYEVTFLANQALRACARLPSAVRDGDPLNSLKRSEVSSCNKFGLESVIAIWTLGVVSPRLPSPLVTSRIAKRINWLVPFVHALGEFDIDSYPRNVISTLFAAMHQASRFVFSSHVSNIQDSEVFPSDIEFFPQLMKEIDIAEDCFPYLHHFKDKERAPFDSKLDALLRADSRTRAFVARLEILEHDK
jgi:hypothetical protein